MNDGMLQQLLDRLAATSWQRSVLIGVAVVSCAIASVTAVLTGGGSVGVVTVISIALAAGAALRPDSHAAIVAIAIVLWQWLALVDDPLTPWAILVSVCLVVFHATVALMAVTPIGAIVDADSVRTWATRVGLAAASAAVMWSLAALLDQRVAPGSVGLTAAALALLAVLVMVARALSAPVQPGDTGSTGDQRS